MGWERVENLEHKKKQNGVRKWEDGYFKNDNDKKINKVVLHRLKDIWENKTHAKKLSFVCNII